MYSPGLAEAILIGYAVGSAVEPREMYASAESLQNLRAAPPPVQGPTSPPSPADRIAAPVQRLDERTARRALEHVDLVECREQGAPRGYVRATVVFAPNGGVTDVRLSVPNDLGPEARECLEHRIGDARAAAFEGAPLRVRASWFLP